MECSKCYDRNAKIALRTSECCNRQGKNQKGNSSPGKKRPNLLRVFQKPKGKGRTPKQQETATLADQKKKRAAEKPGEAVPGDGEAEIEEELEEVCRPWSSKQKRNSQHTAVIEVSLQPSKKVEPAPCAPTPREGHKLSGTGDSQRDSRESIRANHSQLKPLFL